MANTNLPSKDSADLHLVVATSEENLAQQNSNSTEWRGALSLEAYLRREDHLVNQALTKDGGLTAWMLVHQPQGTNERKVLCGCESIKKKALVARNGKVTDVVAHGVASVFCPPEYRGKGYAGRMISELGKRLEHWQAENGESTAFSVLYSDIGKDFYAARGWQVFPSAHVALPASSDIQQDSKDVRTLQSDDISELCTLDEKTLRNRLESSKDQTKTAVALIPDANTLTWHYAREDFVATELNGGYYPDFMRSGRGAIVDVEGGSGRVWCFWTRVWTNPQEDSPDTLHILRLAIEDDAHHDFSAASDEGVEEVKESPVVRAIAALLQQARSAARQSGMKEVMIWNPSSATLAAARLVEPSSAVVHREKESITSLRWYGDGSWKDVDWVANEKYGWC